MICTGRSVKGAILETEENERQMDNQQIQETADPRRNYYRVHVRRDTSLMMTFIKFQNRVSHPRVTFNLVVTGILLALVPTLVENLAMPGVIVSYGVGALLILTGLFRQYLTLSMMRNNPEVKENEEITYYFGNAGIRAVRDGQEKNMGFYKAVYRVWEDEKTFYVGMNEDDLLILPKDHFEEGSAEDFREFLVDKSGADYRWKPLGLVNRWKDFLTQTKNRITYLQMEARERDRNQKGKK